MAKISFGFIESGLQENVAQKPDSSAQVQKNPPYQLVARGILLRIRVGGRNGFVGYAGGVVLLNEKIMLR
jgi:hypothetical protein